MALQRRFLFAGRGGPLKGRSEPGLNKPIELTSKNAQFGSGNSSETPEVGDLVEIPGGSQHRVRAVKNRPGLSRINGSDDLGKMHYGAGPNCMRVWVEGMKNDIKADSVKIIEKAKK